MNTPGECGKFREKREILVNGIFGWTRRGFCGEDTLNFQVCQSSHQGVNFTSQQASDGETLPQSF